MNTNELKDIFLSEAFSTREDLDRLFTELEKNYQNTSAIEAIFRHTHTLKANAAAMGYEAIAEMAHLLEDVFNLIKKDYSKLNQTIFNDLFRANDKLGELINSIKTDEEVKYKGIITRIKVILRNLQEGESKIVEVEEPSGLDIKPLVSPVLVSPNESTIGKHQADEGLPELKKEIDPTNKKSIQVTFADTIAIPIHKLDNLLNLVGELSIESDRIQAVNGLLSGSRKNEYNRLQRITSELQYSVMNVRLVQINILFQKFHRIVRDVAQLEGKQVNLILEGTEIEIDRNILQIISDSLIHLVRNAISHGIELPENRQKVGKKPVGNLYLTAQTEKDFITIEVGDDGKGIDSQIIRQKAIERGLITTEKAHQLTENEIIQYIFVPGFSSLEQISEISGRGVGMDVVKSALDSIGGKISIDTQVGRGTRFCLTFPASMVVKPALLFTLDETEFAIPLTYTEAVISLKKDKLYVVNKGYMFKYLERIIPLIFLKDLFKENDTEQTSTYGQTTQAENLSIIIVAEGDNMMGLVVDKLSQQKEIMDRPFRKPLENIKYLSGTTLLGSGYVCLVLDIHAIFQLIEKIKK